MVEDNPYNAWYVKTTVEGAPGMTVGVSRRTMGKAVPG
jgi:hypothetical protein